MPQCGFEIIYIDLSFRVAFSSGSSYNRGKRRHNIQQRETMTKDQVVAILDKSDVAVKRAILVVWENQTADEQISHQTLKTNGVGFTGADAAFGTSLAEQINKGYNLSAKQIAAARKMTRKYWKQLVAAAEQKMVNA